MGNLVLFLILEEMLSIFHHWRFCLLGFSYTAFIVLRYIPFTLVFWRLIIKRCWILSKFLCIYWDNHIVFYDLLHFCVVCCDFSISVLILLFWFFPINPHFFFFLITLDNALSLIYILKEPDFHFISIFHSHFCFLFTYLCSAFYGSFHSTNFRFLLFLFLCLLYV